MLSSEIGGAINILNFQNDPVTLVVVPNDLRCGYAQLCSIAENEPGSNLSGGKEAIVFIPKTRWICKFITDFSLYYLWLFSNFREYSLIY